MDFYKEEGQSGYFGGKNKSAMRRNPLTPGMAPHEFQK